MLLSRGPLRRGTAALQRCASLGRFYSTPIQNDAQQKPAVSIVFGQQPPSSLPDPFAVVASQLRPLETSLKDLVGSDHPVLTRVAQHFFELVGKRFRPTIVLLAASAAAGGEPANARQVRPTQHPYPTGRCGTPLTLPPVTLCPTSLLRGGRCAWLRSRR